LAVREQRTPQAALIGYARDWYQKGYVLQDAATTQEAYNSFLSGGRTTGFFIAGEEGQAEQITTATGVPVIAIKILNPYVTTAANAPGFAISATSRHPEASMKFLNEMYVDADVVNLLDWGVEGVHYEIQDDGTVDFPDGVDAANTTYGLNLDWMFGNQFLSRIWGKGRDTTIYERLEANNRNAEYSPAMGFSYDSTPVRNELTALQNAKEQYLPGLATGTVDPETELPKFLGALKSAGIDVVIAEKQRQLDAWLGTLPE
jgi:putative aldouronate transport system substrate-binding protein